MAEKAPEAQRAELEKLLVLMRCWVDAAREYPADGPINRTVVLEQVDEWTKRLASALPRAEDTRPAADDEIDALRAQVETLQKQVSIMDLATPIEDELSARIDETCKYLAMEQGFTLNGIARLLIDCQKRMAADWIEIGNVRRRATAAESQVAQLTTREQP